jgi:hypothetical protein
MEKVIPFKTFLKLPWEGGGKENSSTTKCKIQVNLH